MSDARHELWAYLSHLHQIGALTQREVMEALMYYDNSHAHPKYMAPDVYSRPVITTSELERMSLSEYQEMREKLMPSVIKDPYFEQFERGAHVPHDLRCTLHGRRGCTECFVGPHGFEKPVPPAVVPNPPVDESKPLPSFGAPGVTWGVGSWDGQPFHSSIDHVHPGAHDYHTHMVRDRDHFFVPKHSAQDLSVKQLPTKPKPTFPAELESEVAPLIEASGLTEAECRDMLRKSWEHLQPPKQAPTVKQATRHLAARITAIAALVMAIGFALMMVVCAIFFSLTSESYAFGGFIGSLMSLLLFGGALWRVKEA